MDFPCGGGYQFCLVQIARFLYNSIKWSAYSNLEEER